MRFELVIRLGNEAMQETADVAEALRAVATWLDPKPFVCNGDATMIRDRNGNKVGSCGFHEDEKSDGR